MQAFGIAALVFAIIGIIAPFGYFISTLSGLLAFFSSGRGTALGAASVIINIINIYILSPTLVLMVMPARIARKTPELSGQEMLFLVLILIQISALTFLAAHWLFSSIENNEESENTIMIKNAIKSFSVLILGAMSIFSIGLAGKMAFAIKKPQRTYMAARVFPEQPAIARASAPPISTGKSWAQYGFSNVKVEAEETFSGEPFTFDIWTAGMDEVDLLKTAKRNGISLFDDGSTYRYGTKLLDEYASVRLHLTAKTRRLMKVSISWSDGRKVKAAVLELLERQNAVSHGNVYKIGGRTEIELEGFSISLKMTYKDIAMMRADVAERRQKNEEERRHAIAKDGDRFFKKNEIEPQVQENKAMVYKITGQNGKITYTNDPAKAAAQKGSPVELKHLETVQLKELTGYVIYLKDGRIIDSKAASSDGRTVRFKEGKINIGIPVEQVDDVKGLYRAGNETSAKSLDFRGGF